MRQTAAGRNGQRFDKIRKISGESTLVENRNASRTDHFAVIIIYIHSKHNIL